MDIVSHTLTGLAAGTVVACFTKESLKSKVLIVAMGGLGGALPDLDAISLWSKFDSTIGAVLNLPHSGKEIYFGKLWYSHHAALHSLLAPIFFIILVALPLYLRGKRQLKKRSALILIAFCFGYVLHLMEDMITPASVWGGVNLSFPSSAYVGGFGKIWWWNNYDLVLIISGVILLNVIVNIVLHRKNRARFTSALFIFLFGSSFFLFQINRRPVDFSYTGHTPNYASFEQQSKEIQKEILGEELYEFMSKLDESIPLNF